MRSSNSSRRDLSKIVVRQAKPEDVDAIYSLELRCFEKDAYPRDLFVMYIALYPELFIVAEDVEAKRLVGYACGVVRRDGFGHVVSICVDPQYRGLGIGKKLMIELEERFRRIFGVCRFRLEVRVSNERAIALYRSLGYTVARVLKNYYMDGEDAYLMIKDSCGDRVIISDSG